LLFFQIPDQNFEKLDEIWKQLTKQGIYLLDYHAFAANSFRADLGRVTMLTSINKILQDAGGRIANKFTLLIGEGESQDLEVAYLEKAQSIFYISTDGSMTGNTLGPGYITMRLLAKQIPNLQGVSNVQFSVFFKPPLTTLHALEIRPFSDEYLFRPFIFNSSMRAGDLITLGPDKLNNDPTMLDGLFFGEQKDGKFFRLYLILCTGVLF
jgi:hypothetical protein